MSWPGAAGEQATVKRKWGAGMVDEFGTYGASYFDRPQLSGAIEYVVDAASGTFSGTVTPVAQPPCMTTGSGGGTGSGPPECDWVPESPGVAPFSIVVFGTGGNHLNSNALPWAQRPLKLTWRDSAVRSGYVIDVGPANISFLPPGYNGQVVALTGGTSILAGERGSIPDMTGDAAWQALLDEAGFWPREWPSLGVGSTAGWRMRPVVMSDDRRAAAIGPAPMFPRLFRAQ